MRSLILTVAVMLGCSSSNTDADTDPVWHCFDSETDFGCVCEPGAPAYEPTGETCPTDLGCCFRFDRSTDTGETVEACRCTDDADCSFVEANGWEAVAACP